MNLWIRSQSMQTLMKVSKIWHEQNEIFACVDTEFSERVGIYETEERALEVLTEIEERISLLETMKLTVGDTTALVAFKRSLGEDKIKGLGYPYQMPKE